MKTDPTITPADLVKPIDRLFSLAADKVRLIERTWDKSKGTPVFTIDGKYASRGWTEWTQGFQYGCAILTFDATGDRELLDLGRNNTVRYMAPHVSHVGVHDHGFNNLSTYGNLRRLMREGRIDHNEWELNFYEMAIKTSGAVQAARWSDAHDPAVTEPLGYVYSFNGPHSLFIDTMRTIRIMSLAHELGHVLMGENDRQISLLGRMITHALTTDRYIVFHGDGTHAYDVRGRTAHEGTFNRNDGRFRARSTQQGFSPFSTWTRGLAWAMLGYAEQLEFLAALGDDQISAACGLARSDVLERFQCAARATCDHYIQDVSASDGIPYWDDGAPGLSRLGDWRTAPADPYNNHEPVDSSAASIAAQALIRFGHYLGAAGSQYTRAGLMVSRTLLNRPYLSERPEHQGLLLHSVYHRPNGWDHVPPSRKVPCDESSMWGDYHLLELALLIRRLARGDRYYAFFDSM
jgi:unsaturated chondroitin disaccharide hydrolase